MCGDKCLGIIDTVEIEDLGDGEDQTKQALLSYRKEYQQDRNKENLFAFGYFRCLSQIFVSFTISISSDTLAVLFVRVLLCKLLGYKLCHYLMALCGQVGIER